MTFKAWLLFTDAQIEGNEIKKCRLPQMADSLYSSMTSLEKAIVCCRGLDGATNVILFAFYPGAAVQGYLSLYQPSLGLSLLQIQLLQGYLYWVCRNFIVPSALFGGPAGQPLGPAAGGLLVKRSVYDWINGNHPHHTALHAMYGNGKRARQRGRRSAFPLLGLPAMHVICQMSCMHTR
jgi:hypothetical protein